MISSILFVIDWALIGRCRPDHEAQSARLSPPPPEQRRRRPAGPCALATAGLAAPDIPLFSQSSTGSMSAPTGAVQPHRQHWSMVGLCVPGCVARCHCQVCLAGDVLHGEDCCPRRLAVGRCSPSAPASPGCGPPILPLCQGRGRGPPVGSGRGRNPGVAAVLRRWLDGDVPGRYDQPFSPGSKCNISGTHWHIGMKQRPACFLPIDV